MNDIDIFREKNNNYYSYLLSSVFSPLIFISNKKEIF